MRVRALSERRAGDAAGVEGVLAAVAERALRKGARAGLDALLQEALRLTGAIGIALYEGRARVAQAGLKPPPLAQARAPQVTRAPDGRTVLVVVPERGEPAEREALVKLARLASTLLGAGRREAAAQARQANLCRELRELEQALAYRERSRSRASHDLRTPLLVMKGYVDMMRKGMTGELTPTMERYLERIHGATQDMSALIAQRLAAEPAPEDLLPLLRGALEQLARPQSLSLRCECSLPAVPVRGARSTLAQLTRTLARGLAAAGATQVALRIEAREATRMWHLNLSTSAEQPLPTRTAQQLEGLVQKLGGTLRVRSEPQLELSLQLPAA